MNTPKTKNTKFIPKVLSKSAALPREAKKTAIERYRAAQKNFDSGNKDNAGNQGTQYAEAKITKAAETSTRQGQQAAGKMFKKRPEKYTENRKRPSENARPFSHSSPKNETVNIQRKKELEKLRPGKSHDIVKKFQSGRNVNSPRSSHPQRTKSSMKFNSNRGYAKKTISKVKKLQSAAQKANKTKKRIRAAKTAAKRSVQAAKQAAKNTKRVAVAIARVAKAAIQGLISIAIGAGGVLIPILLIVAIIGAVVASPFGVFFSASETGENIKTLSQIINETNTELADKIETVKTTTQHDEYKLIFDGSETNSAINNWTDVIAVFSVKTTMADEANTDVITLDADREARLKTVFWDMTPFETSIKEETRSSTVTDDEGNTTTESYIYRILTIIIDSLSYKDGAQLYHFNADQNEALNELMSPENYLLMLDILCSSLSTLTPAEVAALMKSLEGLDLSRQSVVTAALSLEGKVAYFWGGKSEVSGWDSRWGTLTEVTAAGSRTSGTVRPFGLDCSGYLGWCFAQIGVKGWSSASYAWSYSIATKWELAEPGDIVYFAQPGTMKSNENHLGIIVGFDNSGSPLVAHCNAGKNNVSITEAFSTGFKIIRKPVFFVNQ